MQQEQKQVGLFSKIASREDALQHTNELTVGLFVLATIQGIIGYFFAPLLLIDVAVLVILAVVLRRWKSRVAAVLLLLTSMGIVVTTILTKFGIAEAGGSNIFLALILLWTAIRAVHSTFLLHGRFAEPAIQSYEDLIQ